MNLFRRTKTESAPGAQRPHAARNRRALGVLAVIAASALLFEKPLRHQLLSVLALRSDAPPSDAALEEIAGGDRHSAAALERIWRKGQWSGRLFVLRRLREAVHSNPSLVRKMDFVLSEAVWDVDPEVREAALKLLALQKDPRLRQWLREQLSDADPALRVLGLQALLPIADTNDVPATVRLLDDPDPRVVVAAGALLKRVTRQDFGLKFAQAPPRFTPLADAPPAPVDWAGINRGRDGWREWWRAHRGEFPTGDTPAIHEHPLHRQPTADFALENTEGRTVRLYDFRGKTVLLAFWSVTNQQSFADEPSLQALQKEQADRLVVLAVAFNPAIWGDGCGDHDDHSDHAGHDGEAGEGHAHSHAHAARKPPTPDEVRVEVREAATRVRANHPVLVDPQGSIVRRFNAHDFPTYAFIDAEGNWVRRVAGSRAEGVLRAMVEDVNHTATLSGTLGR